MKFKISVERPMLKPDIPRYDMWVPSRGHSTHTLFSWFVSFECAYVDTPVTASIQGSMDNVRVQFSPFTLFEARSHLLTILYTRLTGP